MRWGKFEGTEPLQTPLPPLKAGYQKESQREAEPLLHNQSPFPLSRGRGIKGDRVTI